jgi:hypothetical protein
MSIDERDASRDIIRSLYKGLVNREPDEQGWCSWADALRGGVPLSEIVRHFIEGGEFRQMYASQQRAARPAVDAAEFLFPSELAVTPSKITKVLIIGSCMSEAYRDAFGKITREVTFDHILFNNFESIPDVSDEVVSSYNFQFIQLPLRNALSDVVINFRDFLADSAASTLIERGCEFIRVTLDGALKYNKSHGLLSFVSNFFVPQTPVVASTREAGSITDLCEIIRIFNKEIAAATVSYRNAYLIDVDAIAASIGKRYVQDDSIAFYSHAAVWSPSYTELDTSALCDAPPGGRIEPLPDLDALYGSHRRSVLSNDMAWSKRALSDCKPDRHGQARDLRSG